MWRTVRSIYLEPGEAAVLAEAARQAAACSEPHPRPGLLRILAAALESLAEGDGLLLQPASATLARHAAHSYVLHDGVRTVPVHPHRAG